MKINIIFKYLVALQNRYIPALLLIAIFSLFSYINMTQTIISIQNDGKVINQSGIQRMLSQHLVLLALNYLDTPSTSNKKALQNSIDIMKKSHKELLNVEQNGAIKKLYYQDGLLAKLDDYFVTLEQFVYAPDQELLLKLSKKAQEVVPLLSRVVKEYELFNLEKVKKLEQRQLHILMATFVLLVLMLLFIFYPASKRITHYQNELEEKVKEEVLKNRQKDLMLSQQARSAQMGEMIDMIAHQWRQPLNSLSLINSRLELDAMMNKLDVTLIEQNTKYTADLINYLNHTIDDFRDFFKPNKPKSFIICEDLIDGIFTLAHIELQKYGIHFYKQLDCKKEIYTFTNELKQVILTLVSNALYVLVDRSVKEPFVKIRIYDKNGYFTIEVSDNGGGIDESIMPFIFEANFSTKGNNGSGLGLYISKIIVVNQLGGDIEVKNSDEGAIFYIKIPTT